MEILGSGDRVSLGHQNVFVIELSDYVYLVPFVDAHRAGQHLDRRSIRFARWKPNVAVLVLVDRSALYRRDQTPSTLRIPFSTACITAFGTAPIGRLRRLLCTGPTDSHLA